MDSFVHRASRAPRRSTDVATSLDCCKSVVQCVTGCHNRKQPARGPRPRSLAMKLPASEAVASQSGLLGRVAMTSSRCRGALPLARRRGLDRQGRPSQDVLAPSHLAAVFNSVMLNCPVLGVVNDKLRTVRAHCSSGSASYGTSPASSMLVGVRHRDGNSGILQAGVYDPPQAAGQAGAVAQRRLVSCKSSIIELFTLRRATTRPNDRTVKG